jgi:hypothetical protein
VVVHIEDGSGQSYMVLSPAQSSAGSITYAPKTSEVAFRMDAYSGAPNATGTVQIVNAAAPPAVSHGVPVPPMPVANAEVRSTLIRSTLIRSTLIRSTAIPSSDPEVSVRVDPQPVPDSRTGLGSRQLRSQAAVPLYQPQLSLKAADRRGIHQPVSADVKVLVGKNGTVTSGDIIGYGEPPNWSLANAALVAALHWTFQPARIGDVAVASEVILHFRFKP